MLDLEIITKQFMKGLPSPICKLTNIEKIFVSMRDGIKLETRIIKPMGFEAWPVILMRFPYIDMLPILMIQSTLFAEQGYIVVLQSCRGTGGSEGKWIPFENEEQDGLDTLEWIENQSWMDGNIATYGHSYLSAVQWIIANQLPKSVKTMCLSGFTTERYRQMYMNGMFRQDVYTGWAIENSGVSGVITNGLFQKAVELKPHIMMDKELFGQELSWYRAWVTNMSPLDDYWSSGFWAKLKEIPKQIQIPILMFDGWFDQHIDGMYRDFKKLPESTRHNSRFIIGPWTHSLRSEGDLMYSNDDLNPVMIALEWFNHQLKGKDYPHLKDDIYSYILRKDEWKHWGSEIFPAKYLKLFLCRSDKGSKILHEEPSKDVDVFLYEYTPSNPLPTKGGAGLLRYLSGQKDVSPAASVRQDPPDFRKDVLSFMTKKYEENLIISGSIKLKLYVSSNCEDTSFTVNILEVLQDGSAFNIRDGITSLCYRNDALEPIEYLPDEIVEINFELWPITWQINKNSRLRLDISSSNFPAYHVHSNMAGVWALQSETKTAIQSIYIGGDCTSELIIPYVRT